MEDNYNALLTSIKYFFITDENGYTKQYYLMKIRYYDQIENCEMVYKLFMKWKPYEKYDMGECRGTFLELLSYKLLTKKNIRIIMLSENQRLSWTIIKATHGITYAFMIKILTVMNVNFQ